MRLSLLSALLAFSALGLAQQASQTSNSPSASVSLSSSASASASAAPSASLNGTSSANSTAPASATSSLVPAPLESANGTASAANSTAPAEPHLHTVVDGTFGVLGVFLLLTGLPLTFWGSRNRWSSFAIVGTYAGALVVGLIILRVGVINQFQSQETLPSSTTRGLYLFASLIAGLLIGGLSLVFWTYAQFFVSALGGVALGLFILALKSDSLIHQLGFKLILIIGLAAVGFVLAVLPACTTASVLVGTAILGASATILGIDCLTTAGLKEFYVWNIGLGPELWPKLAGQYKITLPIQIELACIAALTVAGIATQMRFYKTIITKAKELRRADRARDDAERAAGRKDGAKIEHEIGEWEKQHGGDPFRRSSSFFGGSTKLDRYGSESTVGERSPGAQEAFLPKLEDLASSEQRRASATPAEPSQWEQYLKERQVFVEHQGANRKPHRASTTTVPSAYVLPAVQTSDSSEEENLPLAEAMSPPLAPMSPPLLAHERRHSSATLLASGRIVELDKSESDSHASDELPLGTIHPRRTTSLGFGASVAPSTSQSRSPRPSTGAFVAGEAKAHRPRPASLGPAHSLSDTVLPRAAQRPANPRRSSTLLDLNEEAPVPLVGFERRRMSTGPQRIITSSHAPKPREEPQQNAKIMDLSELEARHRRRVSEMQGRAKEEAEKADIKAKWEKKVAREAQEQKDKAEARRAAADALTKKEKRQSVGSINTLLKRNGGLSPTVDQQVDSFIAKGREPAGTANARRNSQAQGQARPDLKAMRRNSLGSATLLGSLDAMAEFGAGPSPARPALVQTASADARGSRRMSGIDKVAAWQQPQGAGRVASPGPMSPVSPRGATSPRGNKKTDWFGY